MDPATRILPAGPPRGSPEREAAAPGRRLPAVPVDRGTASLSPRHRLCRADAPVRRTVRVVPSVLPSAATAPQARDPGPAEPALPFAAPLRSADRSTVGRVRARPPAAESRTSTYLHISNSHIHRSSSGGLPRWRVRTAALRRVRGGGGRRRIRSRETGKKRWSCGIGPEAAGRERPWRMGAAPVSERPRRAGRRHEEPARAAPGGHSAVAGAWRGTAPDMRRPRRCAPVPTVHGRPPRPCLSHRSRRVAMAAAVRRSGRPGITPPPRTAGRAGRTHKARDLRTPLHQRRRPVRSHTRRPAPGRPHPSGPPGSGRPTGSAGSDAMETCRYLHISMSPSGPVPPRRGSGRPAGRSGTALPGLRPPGLRGGPREVHGMSAVRGGARRVPSPVPYRG
ncbi:hypothetical protein HRbin39_00803 [bacterium HR39]|nr:hypothetical protein HRbin39_00803 [bacterium HR39]